VIRTKTSIYSKAYMRKQRELLEVRDDTAKKVVPKILKGRQIVVSDMATSL
jgi:hypothetical protein